MVRARRSCAHWFLTLRVLLVALLAEVAVSSCPHGHVELFDGECRRSWTPEGAIKPFDSVVTLCHVDDESIARLRVLAASIPELLWKEPSAKFSDTGDIDYRQVAFHFPEHRDQGFSKYLIYPVAKEVHSWIEPLLLNVTAKYNYGNEILPQARGYLNTSIPRLLLARLGRHTKQNSHIDRGRSSRVVHKIHIPLTDAGGKALLYVKNTVQGNGGSYVGHRLDVGFAYEVNNLFPHYASNDGEQERTHLMFEYAPRDVGSEWTEMESPPTQTERQRHRAAMTPEERAAFAANRKEQKETLQAALEAQRQMYHQSRQKEAMRRPEGQNEGSERAAEL